MATSKPRVRRNQSLVEFLANRETVEALLEQGYNVKRVFEHLQEKDAVSVSYWAFRRTLIKMRPQNQHKPGLAPVANAKPSPPMPQGNSVPPAPRSGPQILGTSEDVQKKSNPQTYANDILI